MVVRTQAWQQRRRQFHVTEPCGRPGTSRSRLGQVSWLSLVPGAGNDAVVLSTVVDLSFCTLLFALSNKSFPVSAECLHETVFQVVDPEMSRAGIVHHGVQVSVPPEDVLKLRQKYTFEVFLVTFFDTKRTWSAPQHFSHSSHTLDGVCM